MFPSQYQTTDDLGGTIKYTTVQNYSGLFVENDLQMQRRRTHKAGDGREDDVLYFSDTYIHVYVTEHSVCVDTEHFGCRGLQEIHTTEGLRDTVTVDNVSQFWSEL